jgi:peptidoglycan/xylan/chitin deacetylase (PgdA/CDA1 family)
MSSVAYKSAQFAYHGLVKLKNRLLNKLDPPVVILIYHRVTTLPLDPQMLAVTPANFRAQMRYLKDNFQVLRFEDNWSKVTEPSVVVTFDDGYADNALEALPILEEVGVPGTFFIITGKIDTRQEFWSDELERIVLHWQTVASEGSGQLPPRLNDIRCTRKSIRL